MRGCIQYLYSSKGGKDTSSTGFSPGSVCTRICPLLTTLIMHGRPIQIEFP